MLKSDDTMIVVEDEEHLFGILEINCVELFQ